MSGAAKSPAEAPRTAVMPAWITPALIAETKAVWRPYYAEDLTDEQAVGLLIPVGAMYEILLAGEAENEEEADTADDGEAIHCVGAGQ